MLLRPRKRSWPSVRRVASSTSRRQRRGLQKGSRPSSTSISASAPRNWPHIGLPRPLAGRLGRQAAAAAVAQGVEEFAVRLHDEHVGLAAEAGAVGLELAVELRKGRIATEGVGVQRRSLGVALALDLLRVAVGLGHDDVALLVGVGANLLALGLPRGTGLG